MCGGTFGASAQRGRVRVGLGCIGEGPELAWHLRVNAGSAYAPCPP